MGKVQELEEIEVYQLTQSPSHLITELPNRPGYPYHNLGSRARRSGG
jgi:hypothetical protein